MTEQTVLTKTTRTGQQITVTIREVYPGAYETIAYANGKRVASGNVGKLTPPQGDITHVLQSGKIGVGFTAAEAEVIRQAIETATAEHAATPAGRMQALRKEREAMVTAIRGIKAQAKADFNRLYAQQDEQCWQARTEGEAKVQTAIAALNRWDEAHPEVIAHIQAEQGEATKRFIETN